MEDPYRAIGAGLISGRTEHIPLSAGFTLLIQRNLSSTQLRFLRTNHWLQQDLSPGKHTLSFPFEMQCLILNGRADVVDDQKVIKLYKDDLITFPFGLTCILYVNLNFNQPLSIRLAPTNPHLSQLCPNFGSSFPTRELQQQLLHTIFIREGLSIQIERNISEQRKLELGIGQGPPGEKKLGMGGVDNWIRWDISTGRVPKFDFVVQMEVYIIRGKVELWEPFRPYDEFHIGDLVTFPAGLKCQWAVFDHLCMDFRIDIVNSPYKLSDISDIFNT